MLGKKKCKILREIRAQIASENDIPFVTEECRYQGDCKGTCPKCESELRYLESQLEKRRSVGKAVTVSALAVSIALGTAGCGRTLEGDVQIPEGVSPYVDTNATEECVTTEGEIAPTDDFELEGEVASVPEESELEGDVAYVPEESAPDDGLMDKIIEPDSETETADGDGQN